MTEKKYPVETHHDGRFIVEPRLFNDMQFNIINDGREKAYLDNKVRIKDDEIKQLKEENERLYTILANVTKSNA